MRTYHLMLRVILLERLNCLTRTYLVTVVLVYPSLTIKKKEIFFWNSLYLQSVSLI